ncbi:MAG: PadR family transcriptional regulator [Opitutales bacterium]|nr:PadR family transcriptional regulator [Opitutales bacterium]
MSKKKNSLLQGAVELLILRALRDEDRHGWGIQQRIDQIGSESVTLKQGSLYPALIRLGDQGLIKSEWRITENGRKAKYYILTNKGRKQLDLEIQQWEDFSNTINLIIAEA